MRYCLKTFEMARNMAADLADDPDTAAAIRAMRPPPRTQAEAVIALLKAKAWARAEEIDRAIRPAGDRVSVGHRRVVIAHARQALRAEGMHINTIYGVGYRLECERRRLPKSTPLNPVRISYAR